MLKPERATRNGMVTRGSSVLKSLLVGVSNKICDTSYCESHIVWEYVPEPNIRAQEPPNPLNTAGRVRAYDCGLSTKDKCSSERIGDATGVPRSSRARRPHSNPPVYRATPTSDLALIA